MSSITYKSCNNEIINSQNAQKEIKKTENPTDEKIKFFESKLLELSKNLKNGNYKPWKDYCIKNLKSFDIENLCNALNIYSKCYKKLHQDKKEEWSKENNSVVELLMEKVSNDSAKLTPGMLANITQTLSTLKLKNINNLNEVIAKEIVNKLSLPMQLRESQEDFFTTQELTSIGVAFVDLSLNPKLTESLYEHLAIEIASRADRLNCFDLSETIYLFEKKLSLYHAHEAGTFKLINYKLFNLLIPEIIKKSNEFTFFQIYKILYCFSNSNFKPENCSTFVEKVSERLLDLLKDRNELLQDNNIIKKITLISWSLVSFKESGVKIESLFDEIASLISNEIKVCNNQDLANTAWAFSIFSLLNSSTKKYHTFIKNLVNQIEKKKDLKPEELHQTHHVLLYLKFFADEKDDSFPKLRIDIAKHLEKFKQTKGTTSDLQKNIHKSLESLLQTNLDEEFFIEGYSFDIILDLEQKIAVEIDGPFHFLSNGEYSVKDFFKSKITSKLGWRIFRVCYKNWYELKTEQEKTQYLLKNQIVAKLYHQLQLKKELMSSSFDFTKPKSKAWMFCKTHLKNFNVNHSCYVLDKISDQISKENQGLLLQTHNDELQQLFLIVLNDLNHLTNKNKIINLMQSLAKLGIKTKETEALFTQLVLKISNDFNKCTAKEKTDIAIAIAKFGVKGKNSEEILSAMVKNIGSDFNEIPADILADYCYQLAIISANNPSINFIPSIHSVLQNLETRKNQKIVNESLLKICRVIYYLNLFSEAKVSKFTNLESQIQTFLKNGNTISKSEGLKKALLNHDNSKMINHFFVAGYLIDYPVNFVNKTGFIFDEQVNKNSCEELPAETLFRTKLFKKLGWSITPISIEEWKALKSDRDIHYFLKNHFEILSKEKEQLKDLSPSEIPNEKSKELNVILDQLKTSFKDNQGVKWLKFCTNKSPDFDSSNIINALQLFTENLVFLNDPKKFAADCSILFQSFQNKILENLSTMKAQELKQVLKAYTILNMLHKTTQFESFLNILEKTFNSKLDEYSFSELLSLRQEFSCDKEILQSISKALQNRIDQQFNEITDQFQAEKGKNWSLFCQQMLTLFSTQNSLAALYSAAEGFQTLSSAEQMNFMAENLTLVEHLCFSLHKNINTFSLNEYVNIISSLNNLNSNNLIYPPKIFSSLVHAIAQSSLMKSSQDGSEFPSLAYAFANFGYFELEFSKTLAQKILANMESYDISQLNMIAWAFVEGFPLEPFTKKILDATCINAKTSTMPSTIETITLASIFINYTKQSKDQQFLPFLSMMEKTLRMDNNPSNEAMQTIKLIQVLQATKKMNPYASSYVPKK